MKTFMAVVLLLITTAAQAAEPPLPLLAQAEPLRQVDMRTAPPRVMPLYEQGWEEGAKIGHARAGKIGWFFIGFGNVPFLWLPWTVEPTHPAKPPIVAEEEFNNGYRHGYRAGWKNAHKAYYIAGTIVSSAAIVAVAATQ